MAFRPEPQQPDFADLIVSLSNSRNQIKDNALYQTVFILLQRLTQSRDLLLKQISQIDEDISTALAATYLTAADETADLVNSRQLIAGSNISFDDTTSGRRVVNSNANANVIASYGFESSDEPIEPPFVPVVFKRTNLKNDVVGILQVANGGTGLSSLSQYSIPYGNGTSPFFEDAGFTFNGTTLLTRGQIEFPVAQSASSNANTLDDYEEGTFTPTDASGAGLSFSTANGNYVKIGQLVYIALTVVYPATADGSQAKIGSLPFTSASAQGSVPVGFTDAAAAMAGIIQTSTTVLEMFAQAGGAAITNANLTSKTVIMAGTYRSAA